jgi:hypothetical protein
MRGNCGRCCAKRPSGGLAPHYHERNRGSLAGGTPPQMRDSVSIPSPRRQHRLFRPIRTRTISRQRAPGDRGTPRRGHKSKIASQMRTLNRHHGLRHGPRYPQIGELPWNGRKTPSPPRSFFVRKVDPGANPTQKLTLSRHSIHPRRFPPSFPAHLEGEHRSCPNQRHLPHHP